MNIGQDDSGHQEWIRSFVRATSPTRDAAGSPSSRSSRPRVTRVGRWLRNTSLDELRLVSSAEDELGRTVHLSPQYGLYRPHSACASP
jgi:hypothetical protein